MSCIQKFEFYFLLINYFFTHSINWFGLVFCDMFGNRRQLCSSLRGKKKFWRFFFLEVLKIFDLQSLILTFEVQFSTLKVQFLSFKVQFWPSKFNFCSSKFNFDLQSSIFSTHWASRQTPIEPSMFTHFDPTKKKKFFFTL